MGPEGGRPGMPTQADRNACSVNLGIVKILHYYVRHVNCVCNKLEAIIYCPKPQPSLQCLTQVTWWNSQTS
jgi:hypothetical protein